MAIITVEDAKFSLGNLSWTPGINDAIADNADFALFIVASLKRHARGDWGDMTPDDIAANDAALATGDGRLFSAYKRSGGERVWIITDGGATAIMFPSEY